MICCTNFMIEIAGSQNHSSMKLLNWLYLRNSWW